MMKNKTGQEERAVCVHMCAWVCKDMRVHLCGYREPHREGNLEHRPAGSEGESYANTLEKNSSGRRNSKCKGSETEMGLLCFQNLVEVSVAGAERGVRACKVRVVM